MDKPETSKRRPTLVETLDRLVANEKHDFREIDKRDYERLRAVLQELDEVEAQINAPYEEEDYEVWNACGTDLDDDDKDLREPMGSWENEGGA